MASTPGSFADAASFVVAQHACSHRDQGQAVFAAMGAAARLPGHDLDEGGLRQDQALTQQQSSLRVDVHTNTECCCLSGQQRYPLPKKLIATVAYVDRLGLRFEIIPIIWSIR